MLVWNGYRFSILFLLCYGGFLFDIFSGEISPYISLYFLAVSRVHLSVYYSHFLFCLLLGLDSWELFWRAGSYVFFCVRLRYVECRAGTIYLSVGLEWVAWLYGFFFSWVLLRWVRYDWNSGGVWSSFLFFLQFCFCTLGGWFSVVGLHFLKLVLFGTILVLYAVSYFISC